LVGSALIESVLRAASMTTPARELKGWRRVLVMTSSGLLFVSGSWHLVRGSAGSATLTFVLAAAGVVALVLPRFLEDHAGRSTARASVELFTDLPTALRWAMEALREFGSDTEVHTDPQQMAAWTDVERSWRSWGERVTVELTENAWMVRADVSSAFLRPQLIGARKNQSNVQKIVGALSSRGPRGPWTGRPS
jgi:hypothetical protein